MHISKTEEILKKSIKFHFLFVSWRFHKKLNNLTKLIITSKTFSKDQTIYTIKVFKCYPFLVHKEKTLERKINIIAALYWNLPNIKTSFLEYNKAKLCVLKRTKHWLCVEVLKPLEWQRKNKTHTNNKLSNFRCRKQWGWMFKRPTSYC